MPLRAVTGRHGEGGLRERLLIEAGRLPAAGRERVPLALGWMGAAARGGRRRREPCACRPLRVAVRILSHDRVDDADVARAALLRDTVEDHAGERASGGSRDDAVAVAAGELGGRVASLVGAVTSPQCSPGAGRHERYRAHLTASLEGCPWARVVKVPDFTDDAVGLFHPTGESLPRRAPKYRPLVPVLPEMVLRADTPLAGDVKQMIARQLNKADGRLAVLSSEDGTRSAWVPE
jgi:hypothetical protein